KGRESFGMLVELHHENGYRTVFAHLSAIRVEEGATVVAGETVGEVGSTGKSTGPHLHFEVWRGTEALDPAAIVESW
ncbi:MAG: M23 family metallopeptidase, partial [Acidobacteria bacterium]|nr:M23 family metallopeptidase [Acidobacteriota bacterium]